MSIKIIIQRCEYDFIKQKIILDENYSIVFVNIY